MVTKDGPESQMGGVGYAQLEGHWALLTAYSGVIQLCQQGIDKKVVEVPYSRLLSSQPTVRCYGGG